MGYGDGAVYQRGPRWWIQYFRHGKRFRESGGKTEKEAKRRLKARMREICGDKFVGPVEERVPVDELLDDLMTHLRTRQAASVRTVTSHLKHVREFFESVRAAAVTTAMIESYIETQQKAGMANATINRQTGALRQAFNLAARRKPPKLTRAPYIPALKEDNARQGFVEPATFEGIVGGLPEHLADIARFAYETGWRKSHVLKLRWAQVSRADKRVMAATTAKNKQAPGVPLEESLWDLVERRWKARRYRVGDVSALSEYVFHAGDGRAVVDFKKSWATACAAAGVPGLLFHDLRRSAVRNMIRGGASQHEAMSVSGHKTQSMLARYDITNDEDRRSALAKARAYTKTLTAEAPKNARHRRR